MSVGLGSTGHVSSAPGLSAIRKLGSSVAPPPAPRHRSCDTEEGPKGPLPVFWDRSVTYVPGYTHLSYAQRLTPVPLLRATRKGRSGASIATDLVIDGPCQIQYGVVTSNLRKRVMECAKLTITSCDKNRKTVYGSTFHRPQIVSACWASTCEGAEA